MQNENQVGMKSLFENSGINAFFAVVAAKVSYYFGNIDSTVATATSIAAFVYVFFLAASSALRFIRELKNTRGQKNEEA